MRRLWPRSRKARIWAGVGYVLLVLILLIAFIPADEEGPEPAPAPAAEAPASPPAPAPEAAEPEPSRCESVPPPLVATIRDPAALLTDAPISNLSFVRSEDRFGSGDFFYGAFVAASVGDRIAIWTTQNPREEAVTAGEGTFYALNDVARATTETGSEAPSAEQLGVEDTSDGYTEALVCARG